MTRLPHAASSVVGYASDTASAVAKVEPNPNRISRDWPTRIESRETGRPYADPVRSHIYASLGGGGGGMS